MSGVKWLYWLRPIAALTKLSTSKLSNIVKPSKCVAKENATVKLAYKQEQWPGDGEEEE